MFTFLKRHYHKIISAFCAFVISALSVLYALPVYASADDWAALGEDVVNLLNSYRDYLSSFTSGDNFLDGLGKAMDIPISWYKVLEDGTKAISPVDDWYYYITDGDDLGGAGGRVHSGDRGGGGSVRPSSEVNPVLPVEQVDQWISTHTDDYMDIYAPIPNLNMYKHSYNTTYRVNPNFHLDNAEGDSDHPYQACEFAPVAPIYTPSGAFGNSGWKDVYIIPFLEGSKDSSGNMQGFTGTVYYHFYLTRSGQYTYLNCESYNLSDNSLYFSCTPTQVGEGWQYLGFSYHNDKTSDTVKAWYYGTAEKYASNSDMKFWTSGDGRGEAITINRYPGSSMHSYDTSDTTLYHCRQLRLDSEFNPGVSGSCDWGYYLSDEPFYLYCNQDPIDLSPIPDNYYITINEGDTIYDYTLTDPDTGDNSTIRDYIINNYSFVTNNNDDPSGGGSSGGGTVSGDVVVGGSVSVFGEINIKSDPIVIQTEPIDININVNGGGSSGSSAEGVQFDEDVSLNNYYDWMNEQTTGFSGFMSQFMSWLPPPVITLLCAGFACVIIARFLGR